MASNDKKPTSNGDNFSSTANLANNAGFQSTISLSSTDANVTEKAYNPFDHRQVAHPNSTIGSLVHLLKSSLGSGILAMPAAFKNAGLVTGAFGTLLLGFICTHCVHILVKTSQEVCIEAKKPSMGFAETCGAVFTHGPKPLRKWGNVAKTVVDYAMTATYLGTLCVYLVFIGTSSKEIFDLYFPDYKLSVEVHCLLPLIPLLLICQIRNLKYLVPFSALANIMLVLTFAITMYYVFTGLPGVEEREKVASITQWPLFMSTVIFAMEGIGVVMPVENEMSKPQHFLGCPGVLNTAMAIVVCLYGVFGFFGYIKYGDEVKGSITLNLPQDEILSQIAKILIALAILFTYSLQFYVPMEMITRKLNAMKLSKKCYNVAQVSARVVIVIVTGCIAAAFPDLELVIGLVGAVFFSTLGLFMPAVAETIYLWDKDLGRFNYVLWKNMFIVIIALIAIISGAYVSIQNMVIEFGSHNENLDNDNSTLVL